MSDSQAYEAVTVASDGVTVTKRYEPDEFPVPAIAFQFDSDREEPVSVTLSDLVPEDVAVEDLGFHPEYGSEYWDIEDDEISFEREIEPDAEYTTVYGIRATGSDNVEQFLTEPTLEAVDPPLAGEDGTDQGDGGDDGVLVGEGDDAVKDVISGDADSVPGLDEEDEDVETLDLKDPTGEQRASAAASSAGEARTADAGSAESDPEDTDVEEVDAEGPDADGSSSGVTTNGDADAVELSGDTLIKALANELREQEVSKDDVKLLRKAFDLAADDGSVKARVTKLQKEVSDVIAYADALEEFLDENGTAEDLVDGFQDDLEGFRSDLSGFESKLDDLEDEAVTEDELAALEGDIESVADDVDEITGSVENVEEDVDSVEESVVEVESTVDDLDDELGDLRDELDEIRDNVGSGDTEDRVDDIEAEIEELKEWREQLSSVIGGGE